MKHSCFIGVSLFVVLLPTGCTSDYDPDGFEDPIEEEELVEAEVDDAANELAARDDPSFGSYVPMYVAHNTVYNGSFIGGNGESCNFSFYFGNYGVGYAWIKMTGGAGCGEVRAYVTSASGPYSFFWDAAWTTQMNVWADATAPAGNIINAAYCVELSTWGSLTFSYNALTNTRESKVESTSATCGL